MEIRSIFPDIVLTITSSSIFLRQRLVGIMSKLIFLLVIRFSIYYFENVSFHDRKKYFTYSIDFWLKVANF